jgi:hypothetical protein
MRGGGAKEQKEDTALPDSVCCIKVVGFCDARIHSQLFVAAVSLSGEQ